MNVVILHGWGHSASMWQSFASKFHSQKVIALDLPGFGSEKLVSEKWDISNYAKWVEKELEKKGVKSAIFIGHSFGGKIATEIAITNPKMVEKLVLIASPVLRRPSFKTKIKVAIHKILKKTFLVNSLNTFTNEEYKEAKNNNLGKVFANSVNYDATERLHKITSPTLIIWGEDDKDAPLAIGQEMKQKIQDSEIMILQKTGHNIYLENPNILYGFINKFI